MDAYSGPDGLAIFLSGGASNLDPSASLGGAISSQLVKGMHPIYTTPVEALIIEDATPENGEGTGTITIDSDGNATYTPPGGSAGTAVAVSAGSRKVLAGSDETKAVRVYRASGLTWFGTAEFELVDALTGVLSMSNVDDTDRQAGETHYRGIFLKALEAVQDVLAWITTGGQSTWSLASETPVAGAIQEIEDDETAPAAVSWVNATSRATAIALGHFALNDTLGLWLRRVFPAAGTVATEEEVVLHLEFKGQ